MRWVLAVTVLLAGCGKPGPTASDCAANEVFLNVCLQCGPTDACVESADACVPRCGGEFGDCTDPGKTCMAGVCRGFCG